MLKPLSRKTVEQLDGGVKTVGSAMKDVISPDAFVSAGYGSAILSPKRETASGIN